MKDPIKQAIWRRVKSARSREISKIRAQLAACLPPGGLLAINPRLFIDWPGPNRRRI